MMTIIIMITAMTMTITKPMRMEIMGGMMTTPTIQILAWIPSVPPTPTSILASTTP